MRIVFVTLLFAACSGAPELSPQAPRGTTALAAPNLCKNVDCKTGDPCVSGACDPNTGACVQTPRSGNACNDGQACTMVDVCQNGTCVGTESTCGMAVVFTPETPRTDDDITASLSIALDPSLSVSWAWSDAKTGVTYPGAVLPWTMTTRGDRWAATATVSDAAGHSRTAKGTVVIADTPPSISAVTLTPPAPARTDTLVCAYSGWSDADSDPPHAIVAWFSQGADGPSPIPGTSLQRKATDLAAGEQVFCRVTPKDATSAGTPVSSPPVTIVDQAPAIASVALVSSPARATASSTLTCEPKGVRDPDGDSLTTIFAWFANGAQIPGASGPALANAFVEGQSITCAVSVSDGYLTASAISPPLLIQPALPIIGSVTVSGSSFCGAWTCAASDVTDVDANAQITLHYSWLINGVAVAGATANALPSGLVTAGAQVVCSVRGDVGAVNSAGKLLLGPATQSPPVTAVDDPPAIASVSLPASASRADTLQCAVAATDDCTANLSYTYAWAVNGNPLAAASGSSLAAAQLQPGDSVVCTATASDGTNVVSAASNSAAIVDTPPQIAAASIASSDARPTRLSTFTCSASGAFDADGDPLTISWAWFVNGAQVPGAAASTLANAFVRGQSVSCSATVSDGYASATAISAAVIVLDAPPAIASVSVSGGDACAAWTCSASAQDPDGDTSLTLHYRWFVDGNLVSGQTGATLSPQLLSGGQQVTCGASADDGIATGAEVQSEPAAATDSPPGISSVSLPAAPHHGDTLTCAVSASDDCDASPGLRYTWLVNGVQVATGPSWTATSASRGDVVTCTAIANDGAQDSDPESASTVIVNQPPIVAAASLTTDANPTRLSTFACAAVGAADPDGDALATTYAWQVDGAVIPGVTGSTLGGGFVKGQRVSCSVSVSDGLASASATSSAIAVGDLPPVVTSVAVQGGDACGSWTCSASAQDPDGDPVNLHYRWFLDGEALPAQTARTLPSQQLAPGQQVACAASADDGLLTSAEVRSDASTASEQPPAIASVSLPAAVHSWSQTFTCAVAASDECGTTPSISYAWQIDGQTVAGASASTFADTAGLGIFSTLSCTATVTGAGGSATLASNETVLVNHAPTLANIAVTSPDSQLTRSSVLTCAVQGVSDADGDPLSLSYAWLVDGAQVASGPTLSNAFVHGDQVSCAVALSDGFDQVVFVSAAVAIGDVAPVVQSATVSAALACGFWSCATTGVQDKDGDQTTLLYRWFINGAEVPGATGRDLDKSMVPRGAQLSCAARASDGILTSAEIQSAAISAAPQPLSLTSVSLPASYHGVPGAPPLTCAVTLSDACAQNVSISYAWVVDDGWPIDGATGSTFYPDPGDYYYGAGGDVISCTATATDGSSTSTLSSADVALVNKVPHLDVPTISASDNPPTTSSTLTCNVTGVSDPDGDPVQVGYLWTIGYNQVGSGQTWSPAGKYRGQTVNCLAYVLDPFDFNQRYSDESFTLGDSPPAIQSVTLTGSNACASQYACTASASDPDGDHVNLHYRWLVNGAQLSGQSGATLSTSLVANNQSVQCAVRGDDGQTDASGNLISSAEVTSLAVSSSQQPITGTLSLPVGIHPGGTLTCAVSNLKDNCGNTPAVQESYWEVNNVVTKVIQGGLPTTFSTQGLNLGDKVYCATIVDDPISHAGTGIISNISTIGNAPPAVGAVSISSPDAKPNVFSSFTCAAASVSDPDGDSFSVAYDFYTVEGGWLGGSASGTYSGVVPKNDHIYCTVSATDAYGATTVVQSGSLLIYDSPPRAVQGVSVSGQLSCGNWNCNYAYASDPDGDGLLLHYQWYANGVAIPGATSAPLPNGDAQKGESLSCSITADDGALLGPASFSTAVNAVDNPPSLSVSIGVVDYNTTITVATLHPGDVAACQLSASDDCTASPAVGTIAWSINGKPVLGVTGNLSTAALLPGDKIRCTATATDSLGQSVTSFGEASIVDQAPTASAQLTSSDTRTTRTSTLTCKGTAHDADLDPVSITYAWQANGATIPGATGKTLAGAFSENQTVTCVVTASDGWLSGTATSPGIFVHSILPTIQSVAVSGAGICTPYTCVPSGVSDGDGDAVTVHYKWSINGVDQGLDQAQLPALSASKGAAIACAAYGDDGTVENGVHLYGASVTSPAVTGVQQPPALSSAAVTPFAEAHAGDVLTCSAPYADLCSASDPLTFEWDVNGAAKQSGASATFSTTGLNAGDQVACKASVSDAGLSASAISNAVTIVTNVWTLTADVANAYAGWSVAVADDLNQDGLRELAIGAPNGSVYNGAPRSGMIYLVNGRKNTVSTNLSDVMAGIGGNLIAGDHGGFGVSTMACSKYDGSGCPTVNDVGTEIIADTSGPNGAGLGFGLAYAGDLDGDGVGDLVATAPYDQVSDLWTGRTYMLSGKSLLARPIDDAVLGTRGFVFDGECGRRRGIDSVTLRETVSNGDLAGWRVTPIGDANGDGLGDFAVSAPNNGDFDEGTVYVVFGRSDGAGVVASDIFARGCNQEHKLAPGPQSGIAGYAAYLPTQQQTSSAPPRWGQRIAAAGDFNGDGYDDLLIAPSATTNSNAAFVQLGGPSPAPRAIGATDPAAQWEIDLGNFSYTFNQATGTLQCTSGLDGANWASGGGGDVNGDGIDDLAFQEYDCGAHGFLNVLYGTRTPPGSAVFHMESTTDGSGRGFEVTGSNMQFDSSSGVLMIVPDLNGDGYDDIVLGVPKQNNGAGAVYVIFGSPTPPVGLTVDMLRQGIGGFAIEPAVAGANFGWSIAAGDVDGDGLTDLVVGAPYSPGTGGETNAGSVQVIFGRDFSGNSLAFKGSPGNDSYTGTSAAESIIGGRGNDVLIGGGGADVIYGGAGDDTIEVDDDSFRRVNGGPGNDTLVLGPRVSGLTLTGQNRRRIQEIENLQLQGQTVTLSKLGLVAMSATAHQLAILGAGTVRLLPGDHWKKIGTQACNGATCNVLADGAAKLLLATTLSTNIPPTVFNGPLTVPENSAAGTTVATLGATDPDGSDAALRFALVSDASGAFSVDAAGHLIVASSIPLDYEAMQWPWNLVVNVTDQSGLTTQATFVISLSDVPEPPVFTATSYHWSADESAVSVLGNVQAIDPDHGDVVTYAIAADPSGIFQIDPVSGDVSLKAGAGFHYALAPSYQLTLSAADTQGHVVAASLQIDIIPQDPLTRAAHVSFELRNWSIYSDEQASSFPGFKSIGLDNSPACGNPQKPGSGPQAPDITNIGESYLEPWMARFIDGPASVVMPVEIKANYLGQICTESDFNYDSGTFNATVPYDVTFSYPEQITPGQTFTLSSSATPSTQGAALWGSSPGFHFNMTFQLKDFGIYLALCSEFGAEVCKTIVDKQGVNGTYSLGAGLPVRTWTGVAGSDPTQLVLAAPITSNSDGGLMDWNSYWAWIASLMGLPSNTGTIHSTVGNYPVDFDYILFNGQMGLSEAASWNFALDMNGVAATLVFEDGSSQQFTVGQDAQIAVPAGADLNGDGRVDVSIQLSLNSTFHDTWHHTETGGYMYTAGYGRLTAENQVGQVMAQRSVGPALKQACGVEVEDAEEPSDPINCLKVSDTRQIDFSPSGFAPVTIQGGFDVRQ